MLFRRTKQRIDIRNLRGQQHERFVVACNGGQQPGVGGFDSAPEASPEVDLPYDAGAEVELGKVRIGRAGIGRGFARADGRDIAGQYLLLRILVADGDVQARLRFEYAQTGDFEAVVLAAGGGNQFVEDGVLENAPPFL